MFNCLRYFNAQTPVIKCSYSSGVTCVSVCCRSVTDPRDGRKVALKKMPNVFQNLVSCKRVFRELRMLCFFKHDNVKMTRHKERNDVFVADGVKVGLNVVCVSAGSVSSGHFAAATDRLLRGNVSFKPIRSLSSVPVSLLLVVPLTSSLLLS